MVVESDETQTSAHIHEAGRKRDDLRVIWLFGPRVTSDFQDLAAVSYLHALLNAAGWSAPPKHHAMDEQTTQKLRRVEKPTSIDAAGASAFVVRRLFKYARHTKRSSKDLSK